MWFWIVNIVEPKMHEQSVELLSWENIVQGFEVSVTMCLQQSSSMWSVKLFVFIYVCLMRLEYMTMWCMLYTLIHLHKHKQLIIICWNP